MIFESEKKAKYKLKNILSPKGDIGNLELSDIIDIEEIRSMMDGFYRLTKVPAAIMDNKNNILLSNGLQDFCMKFHWVHPEAGSFCSGAGFRQPGNPDPGICKHHLHDVVVPIHANEKRLGYLLIGQFLLKDEEIDLKAFKKQAKKYGFNEKEYLEALDKVPRISRETFEAAMSFFIKFAGMLSLLGFRSIQLARSLAQAGNTRMFLKSGIKGSSFSRDVSERRQMAEALASSEARKQAMLSNISDVVLILDQEGRCKYVSPNAKHKIGWAPGLNEELLSLKRIHPNDRKKIESEFYFLLADPGSKTTIELKYAGADAKYHYIELTGVNLINDPNINGILVNFHDITERKIKEKKIVYLTEHNFLTGLYNRRFFDREIKKMDNTKNLPLSVIIGDINGLKLINDALGHDEGDKMIIEIARILEKFTRKGDLLARTGGDEFSILLPRTNAEEACALIKKINAACREHKTKSEIYYTSISMGYATKKVESELLSAKIKEADDNMYKRKLLEHKSLHSSVISSIKTTMLEKDFQTEEHAERLVLLSSALGHALHITTEQMDELELLSTLHDIGKIVVEDKILNKHSSLTPEEWAQMKKHPEVGYRIAMASPELIPIAEYILCHHEKWDGTGYPQGLAGEEIPLLSRILAVTDSYDAMTQDRPYRKAMSKDKAAEEIRKNAGKQFDPKIADIFINDVLLNEDY